MFLAFYEGSWDVRYIRQCGVFGDVGPAEGRWCFERRSTYGVRLKICHCDNMDGCNVASTIVQNYSNLTFFLLVSLSWLFFCSKVTHSVWVSNITSITGKKTMDAALRVTLDYLSGLCTVPARFRLVTVDHCPCTYCVLFLFILCALNIFVAANSMCIGSFGCCLWTLLFRLYLYCWIRWSFLMARGLLTSIWCITMSLGKIFSLLSPENYNDLDKTCEIFATSGILNFWQNCFCGLDERHWKSRLFVSYIIHYSGLFPFTGFYQA